MVVVVVFLYITYNHYIFIGEVFIFVNGLKAAASILDFLKKNLTEKYQSNYGQTAIEYAKKNGTIISFIIHSI